MADFPQWRSTDYRTSYLITVEDITREEYSRLGSLISDEGFSLNDSDYNQGVSRARFWTDEDDSALDLEEFSRWIIATLGRAVSGYIEETYYCPETTTHHFDGSDYEVLGPTEKDLRVERMANG